MKETKFLGIYVHLEKQNISHTFYHNYTLFNFYHVLNKTASSLDSASDKIYYTYSNVLSEKRI